MLARIGSLALGYVAKLFLGLSYSLFPRWSLDTFVFAAAAVAVVVVAAVPEELVVVAAAAIAEVVVAGCCG